MKGRTMLFSVGAHVALATALLGISAMVEMVYHIKLNEALGPQMSFLGAELNTRGLDAWLGAALLVIVGVGLFELTRRTFVQQWGQVQEDIEAEIRRRAAL